MLKAMLAVVEVKSWKSSVAEVFGKPTLGVGSPVPTQETRMEHDKATKAAQASHSRSPACFWKV